MRRFTKLATTVVVAIGPLGGQFKTWAVERASTFTQPEATCDDDEVRKGIASFVARVLGINDPVLGEARFRDGYCEIFLSTAGGRNLGYVRYIAVGYKRAPVIRFYDWPNK